MKKLNPSAALFALVIVLAFACTNNSYVNPDQPPQISDQELAKMVAKTPYIHFELLSDRGENDWDELVPYHSRFLVLTDSYKHDGTATACIACLQHSANVANGNPDTNYVDYPWVVYRMLHDRTGGTRFNTWVYLSRVNIPNQTTGIIAWMDSLVHVAHPAGLKVDSSPNPACLYKLKWFSTDWEQ